MLDIKSCHESSVYTVTVNKNSVIKHKIRPGDQRNKTEDPNRSAITWSFFIPILIFETLNVKVLWQVLIHKIYMPDYD